MTELKWSKFRGLNLEDVICILTYKICCVSKLIDKSYFELAYLFMFQRNINPLHWQNYMLCMLVSSHTE